MQSTDDCLGNYAMVSATSGQILTLSGLITCVRILGEHAFSLTSLTGKRVCQCPVLFNL